MKNNKSGNDEIVIKTIKECGELVIDALQNYLINVWWQVGYQRQGIMTLSFYKKKGHTSNEL